MSRKSLLLTAALLCSAMPAQAQQPAQDFPDGPGKEIFVAVCGGCHDINRARAGYTPDGWNTLQHMMQNFATPISAEDWPKVTAYLIKAFPERPRPPAAIIDGPVKASIKLWDVPTLGSRPHDPVATKDGAIWWTGQLVNKLGRVDLKNGTIREYTLKTPHTGPHGLVEDKDGNIWFTGNHAALIGKLDPEDRRGHGISDAGSEGEGSAQPPLRRRTGSFGSPRSNPTWSVASIPRPARSSSSPCRRRARGPTAFWSARRASRHCACSAPTSSRRVDPTTMEVKEYALPNAASRPRRIAITGDEVWYADFSRGFLGRLNLATGEHKEWQSPSGPNSQPYGIVFAKGAIWYNESFAKPNTIVRFDPKTEKFQTLGDPRRRRHRPQDGRDAGRQSGDRQQPHQSGRPG